MNKDLGLVVDKIDVERTSVFEEHSTPRSLRSVVEESFQFKIEDYEFSIIAKFEKGTEYPIMHLACHSKHFIDYRIFANGEQGGSFVATDYATHISSKKEEVDHFYKAHGSKIKAVLPEEYRSAFGTYLG